MLQSLIVTLREGVEAALVIGIAVAYLSKSGRGHLVRVVYFALAAAILASFAGAVMLQRVSLNQEAVEGYLLLLAAFFVATVVFWMQRTAHTLRQGRHPYHAMPAGRYRDCQSIRSRGRSPKSVQTRFSCPRPCGSKHSSVVRRHSS